MRAPFLYGLLIITTIFWCNICHVTTYLTPEVKLTITAQALWIQQTAEALTQAAAVAATATSSPAPTVPTETPTPSATPTTVSPLIINSTLCWVGPGAKYEVMSSLSKGENVEVVGRGSIPGWIIVKNPRYHEPCWVQSTDVQIDPSFDLNSLQVFTPPALPTNTPKPTPQPTSTVQP